METIFDNLENGNLTDAKRSASRSSQEALYLYAMESLGWTGARAQMAALYLKGCVSFQAYCDAK